MPRSRLTVAVALCLGLPGIAAADSAGGSLDMSVRGGAEVDPAADDERVLTTTGVVDLRALYGERLALAAGAGFELGAEVPGGFAYAVRLEPIGGALRLGGRGWIGVTAGIGGSGVIDRVPLGLELPVTGFAAFDLGRWIRLSSRLRVAWVPTSERRDGGSRAVDQVDELDLEVGVAVGRRAREWRSVFSDGTYLGVFAREQVGKRVVGVTLAIAISGAGRF